MKLSTGKERANAACYPARFRQTLSLGTHACCQSRRQKFLLERDQASPVHRVGKNGDLDASGKAAEALPPSTTLLGGVGTPWNAPPAQPLR